MTVFTTNINIRTRQRGKYDWFRKKYVKREFREVPKYVFIDTPKMIKKRILLLLSRLNLYLFWERENVTTT